MLKKRTQNLLGSKFEWRTSPVGKIAKKTVWKSACFVKSALKTQCHVVKNTLLRTSFSVILPTGSQL